MTNKKSFIAEAQKRILETSLEINRAKTFLDALERFGWEVLNPRSCGGAAGSSELFQEGVTKIRSALYSKMCETLADGFMFVGVDDGLKDLALERLKKHFSEEKGKCRRDVMHFLERWGNVPSSWKAQDEEEFRGEVKQKIKKEKK